MNYFDTSALIKRFVAEAGSELVLQLTNRDRVVTAAITYAEVHGGLARKKRTGELAGNDYAIACDQFEEDWQAYDRIQLTTEILTRARDLIQRHPLRGFDAIHLASAMEPGTEVAYAVTFVAADARLLNAAAAEGLPVVDVEKS